MRKFQNMSKHMYDRRNHENNGPNSWGKFRKFQSKNQQYLLTYIFPEMG